MIKGGGANVRTKDWLMRAWRVDREINALLEARQRAYDMATAATARPKYVCVKSSGSRRNAVDTYIGYSDLINRRIDDLTEIKQEIGDAIKKINDTTLRTLLYERYINCRTWERIAADMSYSYSHIVQKLHPAALREISKIRKENTQ